MCPCLIEHLIFEENYHQNFHMYIVVPRYASRPLVYP